MLLSSTEAEPLNFVPSGLQHNFFDAVTVQSLPLAWTRSSASEDEKLMTILDEFSDRIAKTFLFKHPETT